VTRRGIRILVLANLLVLVGLAFIYPHLMVSPGPLVAGHTGLATDCFACHSPWRGADSGRCMQCHARADIGLRTTQGLPVPRRSVTTSFHQDLIEQDCMACHSDHQGLRPARRPFSHALLQASVRERCQSCHAPPADSLHRQIRDNCAQCHAQVAWKPATFEHDPLFRLDRDHNAACVTCHTGSDFSRYTCYGCHEHQPARVRAEHLEEGIRDFENCVDCHRSAQEEPERSRSRANRGED
jgi:hypothetical protein